MNQKKISLSIAIMTALMIVFAVVEELFYKVSIFETFNSVVNPLLFLATVVCAYFAFEEDTAFKSKWTWLVIAIHFTFALSNSASFISSIFHRLSYKEIIVGFVLAVAFSITTVSLTFKKFKKFLPHGFAVMALGALLTAVLLYEEFSFVKVLCIVLYALLALMCFGQFAEFKKIIRYAIIALSLICLSEISIYTAFSNIVLALIIAPFSKPGRINFAKFTAFLFELCAIASIVVFFSVHPFSEIGYLNDDIKETKENIEQVKEDIAKLEEDVETYTSSIIEQEKNLAKEEENLKTAENNLKAVCDEPYYSSWSCDTPSMCRNLHSAVDDINDKIYTAKELIDDYEYNLEIAESYLESENSTLTNYKESLSKLRSNLVGAYFILLVKLIALALAMIAFVNFAGCFHKQTYENKAVIGCVFMAAASLLFIILGTNSNAYWSFDIFNYPVVGFVARPEFWNAMALAFFVAIFTNKNGKLVKFRVFVIISAAIMLLLAFSTGADSIPVYALYTLALICASLVLVPCVFTEYNSIAKFIFFSIITFGIWDLIWVYNVTKNLNKVSGIEKRKPGLSLFFCIVLPFYFVYWTLKTAEGVEMYGKENGIQFKIDILCLAFMFVCPVISAIILQDKINQIVGKPE